MYYFNFQRWKLGTFILYYYGLLRLEHSRLSKNKKNNNYDNE